METMAHQMPVVIVLNEDMVLLAKININFISLLTSFIMNICPHMATTGKNYTIYQITAFTNKERRYLYVLQHMRQYTSFLNGITNEAALPIYVAVDNCCLESFVIALRNYAIAYAKISDYHNKQEMSTHWQNKTFGRSNDFRSWIKGLHRKYPQILLENVIGYTYEKKDISVLKVSKGEKNPAVFILGGEEGRDWLSPAIVQKFIITILEEETLDELTKYLDFYFLPLLNPDGYTYSKNKERFWSKNRKQFYSKKLCPDSTLALGVNIDRNWYEGTQDFKRWECSNLYPGDNPLLEEETMGLSDFLDTIAPRTIAFFNLRGFDQLITLPYASRGQLSNNHNTIMEIFNFACDQLIQKYNVTYFLGSTSSFFYNFSGNSADWVKKNLNVPVVATIYMKDPANIVSDNMDITLLYEQFETLMLEVLTLAKDLYGPLFNTQKRHSTHISTICVTITVHVLF